jgi:AAA domain-containing protein
VRIAFAGSSGVGKTTLATFVSETFKIPMNPVGSRSVAAAMGFASPYDVDKAGKRAEFQARLLEEKITWERGRDNFVTDRTTMDNIAYTVLHDVDSITQEQPLLADHGLLRYDAIFFCPMDAFFKPGDDPARRKERVYHELYETTLLGFLGRYLTDDGERCHSVEDKTLEKRKQFVLSILRR